MSARVLSHALVALLATAVGAALAAVDPLEAARDEGGWVSYAVPLAGREAPCCYESWRRGEPVRRACPLDGRIHDGIFGTFSSTLGRVAPDAPRVALRMYLRFERGELRQLLAVGADCPVDAEGATVRGLEGVAPAASAALLLDSARTARGDLAEQTLQALALHDGVGTDALLALARDPQRGPALRRQALFWLAQSEDPRALAEIEAILAR